MLAASDLNHIAIPQIAKYFLDSKNLSDIVATTYIAVAYHKKKRDFGTLRPVVLDFKLVSMRHVDLAGETMRPKTRKPWSVFNGVLGAKQTNLGKTWAFTELSPSGPH